ncbi:MAG: ABC transporter ATP-binding protein [Chloroflexi bacterium]|nr:ABC transporter ATP-binding protein [Chloroflexota bacterium]
MIDDDRNLAVLLEDVSVRYRLQTEPQRLSLAHYLSSFITGHALHRDLWALQGINLSVQRGETLGIVGSNGSGKSTLLKTVAQVLKPTTGRIRVRGSVAPLLDLGAGFDPDLTGRENVVLKWALLGHGHPAPRQVEQIVDFAGLRDFADAPLRAYSSGMLARLAFAVATAVEPEVLIVDEVLAVGDIDFQERSQERMEQLRRDGATVLIVSHALDTLLQICDRAVWLSFGRIQKVGPADSVIRTYQGSPSDELSPNVLLFRFDQPVPGTGWYAIEYNADHGAFRWSGPEPRASLRLPLPESLSASGEDILFRCQVLRGATSAAVHSLRVHINDHAIDTVQETMPTGTFLIHGRVPGSALAECSHVDVLFSIDHTETPHLAPGHPIETRRLGVALMWLELRPWAQPVTQAGC